MPKGTDRTIYDLAREAGVSVATASRALSEHPNLNSDKQRRVLELARKHDFKPNLLARNFFHGQSHTLCIVLPEITNPFYGEMFSAADEEAARNDYSLVLFRVPAEASGFTAFFNRMILRRFDGVILAGGIVEKPYAKALDLLRQLQTYMPVVTVGTPIEGLECAVLGADIEEGTRTSVRHLHALGHRAIALLGGDPMNASSMERQVGFFGEMERLGLSGNVQYVQAAGYTATDGEAGAQRLLASVPRAKSPTAVIAINDLVALGALRQFHRMGLRVPEDVAVVGCDNQFFTAFTNPPLTTLDLKTSTIGKLAVARLLDAARGEQSCGRQSLDATLIVRESCGAKLGRRKL